MKWQRREVGRCEGPRTPTVGARRGVECLGTQRCLALHTQMFSLLLGGGWASSPIFTGLKDGYFLLWHVLLRESCPRQVDKKSRGPQGEGSGILKEEERTNFFFLLYLGSYNNNVFCLRTVSGLNLLANSVILKCKLWE